MVIYRCDRCKEDVKNEDDLIGVTFVGGEIPEFDLCDKCYKDFTFQLDHWLKNYQATTGTTSLSEEIKINGTEN